MCLSALLHKRLWVISPWWLHLLPVLSVCQCLSSSLISWVLTVYEHAVKHLLSFLITCHLLYISETFSEWNERFFHDKTPKFLKKLSVYLFIQSYFSLVFIWYFRCNNLVNSLSLPEAVLRF